MDAPYLGIFCIYDDTVTMEIVKNEYIVTMEQ